MSGESKARRGIIKQKNPHIIVERTVFGDL